MIKKASGKGTGGVTNTTILRGWHVGTHFVSLTRNQRVATIMTGFARKASYGTGSVINKRWIEGCSGMAITAIGGGIKMTLCFNDRYGVGTFMTGLARQCGTA